MNQCPPGPQVQSLGVTCTCVVDSTAHKHSFANISANFRKIRNGPNGILRGPGKTDL
jgi:hypothetical protein